jgi:hypothetical protein
VSFWQLFGAIAAVVLAAWGIIAVARYRIRSVIVIAALSFGVPMVGFATYALTPGPPPLEGVVGFLVALLYAAIIGALFWRFTFGRRRRHAVVYQGAEETRRYTRGLLLRALFVVWLSLLLFLFEPAFAVAYLVLNVAWTMIWIPRRWRTRQYVSGVEISVPAERAFEFVTDLKNWPLYRDGVELVSVTPEGPLRLGTEYVARTAIPQPLRMTPHREIENRFKVSALVPGRSYTVSLPDQPGNAVRVDFEPADSGTRITNTNAVTFPFPQASVGTMLNLNRIRSTMREVEARRHARLKQVLEAASSQ